jgi:hypothetical protein
MVKQLAILIGIVTLFSCNETKRNAKIINQHIEIKSTEKSTEGNNPLRKKILGIWTSKGAINADFKIDEKTFYYVDDFANYKYSLIGNTITINYPDYVYKGKVSFNNDTLILRNEENEVKYWKFKE